MDTVPTSTGRPLSRISTISRTTWRNFSFLGREDQIGLVVPDQGQVGGDLDHIEVVDLGEFSGFRGGRTGHAGDLVVEPEIVLIGDAGNGLGFKLNGNALLGFDGLMQPFAVAPPLHDTPRELIDDKHFTVAHHVFVIALKQIVRPERLFEHVLHAEIGVFVEVPDTKQPLGHAHAAIGNDDLVVFLVDLERRLDLHKLLLLVHADEIGVLPAGMEFEQFIRDADPKFIGRFPLAVVRIEQFAKLLRKPFAQRLLGTAQLGQKLIEIADLDEQVLGPHAGAADDFVDLVVQVGAFLRTPGDDERGPRFVDKNRVDLVHDGVVERPLNPHLGPNGHVVAQIVEPELVVGAVGDVGAVAHLALGRAHIVLDQPDGHPEKLVDWAHPFLVAPGQVIVHGDQVHPVAGQRVEVDGHGGDEGLAFARHHLRDAALMQNNPADNLDVEGAHANNAFGHFAHGGKRVGQQVVEGLALGEPLFEAPGLCAQFVVAHGHVHGLTRVDRFQQRREPFDLPVAACAEKRFSRLC